jgi:pimeloyl-ACP methyl ester carboxylesterase
MATFVLVHGAWHGSWCWKRVRRLLQSKGHEVFTPTLTGVADRSHLLSRNVNLETHILDIVNLIQWEELSDIVLCGHSYAGAVVTGVADRMPDRIRSLVYLDAFIPEDGENLDQNIPKVEDEWKVLPIPAKAFNVNIADREWVDQLCTMQPIGCWQQRIRLTQSINQIKNISFIFAQGWKSTEFIKYYKKAQAKRWRTFTIDCGHDVMIDQPEQLAKMLIDTLEISYDHA